MDKIHERDVKTALKQVMLRYPKGARFQYEPVEPSVGAPARLFIFDEEGRRASFPGLDHGMLGWSRKEAYRTLVGIEAGMEAQKLLQGDTIRAAANQLRMWSEERMSELMGERQTAEITTHLLDELTAGF